MKRPFALFAMLALSACAPQNATEIAGSAAAPIPAIGPKAELQASILSDQVAKFSRNLIEQRFDRIFDAQPPLYRRAIRAQTDLTTDELKAQFIRTQTEGSKNGRLVSIKIETSQEYLRYAGIGVSFAVLPTTRVVRAANGKTTTLEGSTIVRSGNLGGFWFLVLDNVEQLRLLQKGYPELRTIKWPGLRIK